MLYIRTQPERLSNRLGFIFNSIEKIFFYYKEVCFLKPNRFEKPFVYYTHMGRYTTFFVSKNSPLK
jgi:hypothetical protein